MKSKIQSANMAEIMIREESHESIDRETARAILGKKLFGPEEWLSRYGIWFSEQQLKQISEFPWDESILNAPCFSKKGRVKETHFAWLGISQIYNSPLNIMKWRELHPFPDRVVPWYKEQNFATIRACCFGWYLALIESVPMSTIKTYQEQAMLLPPEYRAPFAIEEVTKNILYHKINREYPNFNTWIRCRDIAYKNDEGEDSATSDVVLSNCHICVSGAKVRGWAEGRQHSAVGISAFRRNPHSICRTIEP